MTSWPKDWAQSLYDVECAIQSCLDLLARYEARFEEQLGRPRQPVVLPVIRELPTAPTLESAELFSRSMEQLIQEQEQIWRDWQAKLAAWQESVQQRKSHTR